MYMHTCIYTHMLYDCVQMHPYACVHIYVCVHVHTHVCEYACTDMCVCSSLEKYMDEWWKSQSSKDNTECGKKKRKKDSEKIEKAFPN